MLEERIKNKLEELEKLIKETKNSDSQISEKELEELKSFAEIVLSDVYEISDYKNIEGYIEKVYQKEEKQTIAAYKEAILDIQNDALKHKVNDPFNIYEISEKRVNFIRRICDDIITFVEIEKKNQKEKSEKLGQIIIEKDKYQKVLNKFSIKEKISEYDLELIQTMIEDYPISERIFILKEIYNYNIEQERILVESNKNKVQTSDIESEEVVENLIVSTEEIMKIVEDYRLDNEEDFKNTITEHAEEIVKNTDKEKFKAILNYLISKNLHKNFENTDYLFAILLYGTLDTVKIAYEEFKTKEMIEDDFIYKMPSLWVDQEKAKHSPKIKKPTDRNTQTETTLKSAISGLTREEVYEIISICEKEGAKHDKKSLFQQPPEVVSFNFRAYKKYGIPIKSAMLRNSKKTSVFNCDRVIECNMLTPHAISNKVTLSTYCNKFPTFINSIQPGHVLYLQTQYQSGIPEEIIEQSIRTNNYNEFKLRPAFRKLDTPPFNFIKSAKGKIEKSEKNRQIYAEEHNMTSLTFNGDIEDYKKMEEIIRTDNYLSLEEDESILNSTFIKQLDNQYSVEGKDYLYMIEGVRVSRYKVIRLYQALKEYNLSHEGISFSENDMRLFSIGYGTYFKSDIYDNIKKSIKAASLQGGVR